jgi:6-pyruvoyltetrahydropterin/6-carboxytetrahydropterin synthase
MTVFVEDSFDSAHFLPHVPEGHKCRNLHGHTYRIRLEVTGPVGAISGWVVDYAEVRDAWAEVKALLDHRLLNKIEGLHNSTCERVAEWIFARLAPAVPGLSRIELRETERCGVVYP